MDMFWMGLLELRVEERLYTVEDRSKNSIIDCQIILFQIL